MDPNRWQTIERLFFEASELEAEKRRAYLVEACGEDAELLEELESMLDSTGDDAQLRIEGRLAGAQSAADLVTPALPRELGRYRLKELLGRGGMGEVYRAQRSDGEFEQDVALKLLSGVVPGPAAIERFKTERQILARLDHPNIARLMDGGTTPDGRPYLVMQLVEGTPLTEFADARELGISDRLRLFQTVCEAVRYLHQNLVIHRDIKPSNILVTDSGDVRLLDFGIAKLLEADESMGLAQTMTGAVMMTPEAAAPEQVAGEPVTTATDVYGLGVLLFRLLTGHHPYGPTKPSAAELRTWITDGKRSPPSNFADDGPTRRLVVGDVDTIALKALQTEPGRRYGSAGELADDIGRHLRHEPIRAASDSVAYRIRKFVRRHPLGFGAAATIAALVIGFGVVTHEQSRRIEGERDRAEEMVQVLVDLFETSDPTYDANRDTMRVSAFIERTRDRVVDELGNQPDLQVRMKHLLGTVFAARGQFPQAREILEDAYAQHTARTPRPDSIRATIGLDLARMRVRLEGAAAQPFLREVVELQRTVHGERHANHAYALATLAEVVPERAEARELLARAVDIQQDVFDGPNVDLANSLNLLGVHAYLDGDFRDAAVRWGESAGVLAQVRPPDNPDLLTVLSNTAQAHIQLGEISEALALNLDVLERRRGALGDTSIAVATSINNIAMNHVFLFDYPRAAEAFAEAAGIWDVVLPRGSTGTPGLDEYSNSTRNLAMVRQFQGQPAEALEAFADAISRQVAFSGEDHPLTLRMRVQRANVFNDLDEPDVARDSLGQLVLRLAAAAPEGGSQEVAEARTWLGRSLWKLGLVSEAEAAFRQALEFRERTFGPESGQAAESRAGLGVALLGLGSSEGRALGEPAISGYEAFGLHVPAFFAELKSALDQTTPGDP